MITSKVETITPEIAREYLKHNTDNFRKIKRSVVQDYAKDILNGRWQLNGETIVFDKNGVLKNGQHRLAAIILANMPIQIIVVRGVNDDVSIFDNGKVRTPVEQARARNIDATASQLAVANIIVNNFNGRSYSSALYEYVDKHISELNRSARIIGKYSKTSFALCAVYLLLRTKSMPAYEIELFFRLMHDYADTCAEGYDITPVTMARHMIEDRGELKRGGMPLQRERLEILIMALIDFHKNRKRETKYKIQEPFQYAALLEKVRKEDGLED